MESRSFDTSLAMGGTEQVKEQIREMVSENEGKVYSVQSTPRGPDSRNLLIVVAESEEEAKSEFPGQFLFPVDEDWLDEL